MKIERYLFVQGVDGVIDGIKPFNTKEEADVAFLDYTGVTFEQLYDGNHDREAEKYDQSIQNIEIEITDSELQEHEKEKYIALIKWAKDDLEHVFEENGVDYTEENVEALLSINRLSGLQDASISAGWEALDEIVVNAISAEVLEATERIEED